MKLYRVERDYGEITIVELCFAENEDDVYEKLSWTKEDKPPLEIKEETRREGCILSMSKKNKRR